MSTEHTQRVEPGTVWKHKSGRWPQIRYEVVGRKPSRYEHMPDFILLGRRDKSVRPTWESEAWVISKLEQTDA